MKKYLKYLKTEHFITKVLPALFFSAFAIPWVCYAIFGNTRLSFLDIVVVSMAAILWLNTYLRQYWISCIIGCIGVIVSFYFLLALLSDVVNGKASSGYWIGAFLFLLSFVMSVLLILGYQDKKQNNEPRK
jgi:putative effector of murein hydrolase